MQVSSKVSPQEMSFWPRIDDPERSGPQRGLRTTPELSHAGSVWPVPEGLSCASDGVLADRPLLVRQLSVSRDKTPQNILLSQLLSVLQTFLTVGIFKQNIWVSGHQVSKCFYFTWPRVDRLICSSHNFFSLQSKSIPLRPWHDLSCVR